MIPHFDLETLSAVLDDALGADDAALAHAHIESCEACARELANLARTSELVKSTLPRYAAPDLLAARIRANLGRVNVAAPDLTSPTGRSLWKLIAAGLVIAVASSAATFGILRRDTTPAVERELLATHLHSLLPGQLTDVVSNDQHNVKPWFNGRVDLSPPVPRLDSLNFILIGGRVDHVDGRPVAVVVYSRRKHMINVYSWPAAVGAAGDRAPERASANGFNMIHWRSEGLEHWAVSDLNSGELGDLVKAYDR